MSSRCRTDFHVSAWRWRWRSITENLGVRFSVGAWHAEHMLAEIGEDEIGRDRGDLRQAAFAPFALDAEFARHREAAERLHAGFGGMPGRLGGEQLGGVRLLAAGCPGIEQSRGGPRHGIGRLPFRIGARDRELHRLVLPDRTPEYDTLAGIAGGPFDEVARITERFRSHQDPFGVHPIEDAAEAVVLLADEVSGRDLQVV